MTRNMIGSVIAASALAVAVCLACFFCSKEERSRRDQHASGTGPSSDAFMLPVFCIGRPLPLLEPPAKKESRAFSGKIPEYMRYAAESVFKYFDGDFEGAFGALQLNPAEAKNTISCWSGAVPGFLATDTLIVVSSETRGGIVTVEFVRGMAYGDIQPLDVNLYFLSTDPTVTILRLSVRTVLLSPYGLEANEESFGLAGKNVDWTTKTFEFHRDRSIRGSKPAPIVSTAPSMLPATGR